MDEFEIIRRYFTPQETSDSVIVGVGDDGAVLRPDAGRDLIAVVDTLIADVHFPNSLQAEDIGFRSVVVNVSDIAAMGGRPRWMTVALACHDGDPDWLKAFANGVLLAGGKYGVDLVGGDTTHGSETVVTVQVIGDVESGSAITRIGAKPGDGVYVSGHPGDAAAGLAILQSAKPGGKIWANNDHLIRRFVCPDARIDLGLQIAPHASAAIDLSDGLHGDLKKLMQASGVSAIVEVDDIPLSEEILQTMEKADALKFALSGGDDYELCFTAGDDTVIEIGKSLGVPVTRIAEVVDGSGVTCTKGGEPIDFQDDGYRHFR